MAIIQELTDETVKMCDDAGNMRFENARAKGIVDQFRGDETKKREADRLACRVEIAWFIFLYPDRPLPPFSPDPDKGYDDWWRGYTYDAKSTDWPNGKLQIPLKPNIEIPLDDALMQLTAEMYCLGIQPITYPKGHVGLVGWIFAKDIKSVGGYVGNLGTGWAILVEQNCLSRPATLFKLPHKSENFQQLGLGLLEAK